MTDATGATGAAAGEPGGAEPEVSQGALRDALAGAAEAAAVRAEPPPVRGGRASGKAPVWAPPGTYGAYLAPGGPDVTCPFPCSICRRKGRQQEVGAPRAVRAADEQG